MRGRAVVGVLLVALGVVACIPPVLITAPSIVGTPQVSETLTVNPGTWFLSGTYSYQWQRCEADGTGCADIFQAVERSYVAVASDDGKRLRVRVTNTNAFGSQTVLTLPTDVIVGTATIRVSVGYDGSEANSLSQDPVLSGDGRYVAFQSAASNLVPADANDNYDIFVRDLETSVTAQMSVNSLGIPANGYSADPSISDDGRYVAFRSSASNLVPSDTNEADDIFVHDRETGMTSRVSVASDGTEGNWYSGGDLTVGLSGNGRYVAFSSESSNLVADDLNNQNDVFVHDRQTGVTSRVSVASDGTEATAGSGSADISNDGRYVTFSSRATNLVPGDLNNRNDVFVHDRQTGVTSRVSVASDGTEGTWDSGPSTTTGDGRYVAFTSRASLVPSDTNSAGDIYVHDTGTGTTERISVRTDGTQGDGEARNAKVSSDGRFVTFASWASNMVSGDTNGWFDIFVHDTLLASTGRVSIAAGGSEGNQHSYRPDLSDDATRIVFESDASNLVPGDTNTYTDIFVRQTSGG